MLLLLLQTRLAFSRNAEVALFPLLSTFFEEKSTFCGERKKERRDEKIWKKFETNVTSAAAELGFGFRLVRGQRLATVLKERCLDCSMH